MQEWINTTAEKVGRLGCILSMQERIEAKAKKAVGHRETGSLA